MLSAASKQAKIELEPEAAKQLSDAEAADLMGYAHPYLLMTALRRLVAAAKQKGINHLTLEFIAGYGGADRLVCRSLDDLIDSLPKKESELFLRWSRILVTPEGTRFGVSDEVLLADCGKLTSFAIALIPRLVEMGILRKFEKTQGLRYELARASMAPLVRDWAKRREAAMIARRKLLFGIRSVFVALGLIVLIYIVWSIMNPNG